MQFISYLWKIWESLSSLFHHCCTPPAAADIFKNSSLQQKYLGFEINQPILYTMRSSVGHGYAGIQKFNTLMNILKRMTVKTVTKKLSLKDDRCCKCCRYCSKVLR